MPGLCWHCSSLSILAAANGNPNSASHEHVHDISLDPAGNEHKLSYIDLQRKYADIKPGALPALLQHALAARQVRTNLDLQGDRSLLEPGMLAQGLC